MSYRYDVLRSILLLTLLLLAGMWLPWLGSPAAAQAQVALLDRAGQPVSQITDGNLVSLRFTLAQPAAQEILVEFQRAAVRVADCRLAAGEQICTTAPLLTLGWYWSAAGTPAPQQSIQTLVDGAPGAEVSFSVAPRPVVMVHGFGSSWEAWVNYLGPAGYLAQAGIPGYAVGDGQVSGVLNTGRLDQPDGRTNTLFENAQITGDYIRQVKAATGAEMVDLLAHSMGGLISRAYIGRVMGDRDVGQLLMLGSPMSGTECAYLPASLGLYLPATLELRPTYVTGIFNAQVADRRGVQFFALAGDPIVEAFKSPCTSVPTDLAVSLSSVTGIPLAAEQMAVLHIDLNTSRQVFTDFVLPRLSRPAETFVEQTAEQTAAAASPLQFTRIFTGQVAPGETRSETITIEAGVSVASFALYDTSRSLAVSVTGASGRVIELTPDANGLVVVNDPASLVYLGYGFNNPAPGPWQVTLAATAGTPPEGAAYALTAYLVGGAQLQAGAAPILPQVGQPVALTAVFSLSGQALAIQQADAIITAPDGSRSTLALALDSGQVQDSFEPTQSGLYALDLTVRAALPDGAIVERSAFLTFEAQPTSESFLPIGWLVAVGIAGLCLAVLFVVGLVMLRRRQRRTLP